MADDNPVAEPTASNHQRAD